MTISAEVVAKIQGVANKLHVTAACLDSENDKELEIVCAVLASSSDTIRDQANELERLISVYSTSQST